jgi:hypothetical protein
MNISEILTKLHDARDENESHRLKNLLFVAIAEMYSSKKNGNVPTKEQLIEFTIEENLNSSEDEVERRESDPEACTIQGRETTLPVTVYNKVQRFLNTAYREQYSNPLQMSMNLSYESLFDTNGQLTTFASSFEKKLSNIIRFNQSFLAFRLSERFYYISEKPNKSSRIKRQTREFVFVQKYPLFTNVIPLLDSVMIKDLIKYFRMVKGLYETSDFQLGEKYWKQNTIHNEFFVVENQTFLNHALINMII